MHKTKAGDFWRSSLEGWGIPQEILNLAPENPWIHPPAIFDIPEIIDSNISHELAKEVAPNTFLDIGCGGGIAAYAAGAKSVIGVDHQLEMLELFRKNGENRKVSVQTHLGFWPDVSDKVSSADVVAAHHVVYNVQNIEEFLLRMNEHALRRVIIEMPQNHPQYGASKLWEHFWQIQRPSSPTPLDLMNILEEIGIAAKYILWEGDIRTSVNLAQEAHFARIRLCLPSSREQEVLEFIQSHPAGRKRSLATIWWDVK